MKLDIDKLQQLLNEACASGEEHGVQLAVYQNGKLAADLAAGFTDRNVPVGSDTLFPVFSAGKGVTATLAHILYEQGLFDYDEPVSKYWREFAAAGKAQITIRHLLTHTAGLQNTPQLEHIEQQADWQLMTGLLAAASPVSEIGSECKYHAATFGWLVGETLQRITGEAFNDLIRKYITAPLHIESEWYFGTDQAAEERVTLPVPAKAEDLTERRLVYMSNPVIRKACIPAVNGCGTARALAKIYASLIAPGVENRRLLRSKTVELTTQLQRRETVLPGMKAWACFGLGYSLPGPDEEKGRFFGHGGALGAEAFADKKTGLAVAFTKNKLNDNPPNHPLRDRISDELGIPRRFW